MPKILETAYLKYMAKVALARLAGYTDQRIIDELMREREAILPRCYTKQMTLATDKNIFKKREVARAAHECIEAIDQICKELRPKETPV